MTPGVEGFTVLLENARTGDEQAAGQLLPLVYDELRRVASRYMSRENDGHTLQATALVHEAYFKLVGQHDQNWQNRAHFVGVAAQLMRRILIDHARAKHAEKRGGDDRLLVTLHEEILAPAGSAPDVLALDEALKKLEAISGRQARIVELRVFGGLSIEETAATLEVASATIKRDWALARAFLAREMGYGEP
jgi:RNA polymerase sigma factor (TIGR02999 family)